MQRYYFDHNATTPVSPEVLQAMMPVLAETYGNASSLHHHGQAARKLLDEARRKIASFLGAIPEEIVFTSGGTEADNLAILGSGGHVVTTTVEHPAILGAARNCLPRPMFLSIAKASSIPTTSAVRSVRTRESSASSTPTTSSGPFNPLKKSPA